MRSRLLAVVLLQVAAGCAGVDVKRLDRCDVDSPGIRYYLPVPYLLVAEDGTQSIVYLPDMSAQYAVTERWGFGSNKLEINLQDGWNLTKTVAETGAMPDKAIDLLSQGFSADKDHDGKTQSGLYRLVWDASGRYVTSLVRLGP